MQPIVFSWLFYLTIILFFALVDYFARWSVVGSRCTCRQTHLWRIVDGRYFSNYHQQSLVTCVVCVVMKHRTRIMVTNQLQVINIYKYIYICICLFYCSLLTILCSICHMHRWWLWCEMARSSKRAPTRSSSHLVSISLHLWRSLALKHVSLSFVSVFIFCLFIVNFFV